MAMALVHWTSQSADVQLAHCLRCDSRAQAQHAAQLLTCLLVETQTDFT